jgi:simple sugar transport system ATP-binding protein
MKDAKEALRLEEITKVYPNGVIANHGVNMTVLEGEIHALSGENGAGKTTLMKICSARTGTDGNIYIHGEKVKIASPMQAIKLASGLCISILCWCRL